jgi:hypothetical protein
MSEQRKGQERFTIGWFTEGFNTVGMEGAKALLDELI